MTTQEPTQTTFSGLHCPKCGNRKSYVLDSRNNKVDNARRRRYQCDHCNHRYTTYEVSAEEYERVRAVRINTKQFELVINQLRTIKVQFGDPNGHR